MKPGTLLLLLSIAAGTVVLTGLGIWQLNRLEWKQAMIARVTQGLSQDPVSVSKIEALVEAGADIEYRPATAQGTFLHELESHFFATHKGQTGYFIYTPMLMDEGKILIVNRGFVPMALKDGASRKDGQVRTPQSVTGLARSAPAERPNAFVPDNDLQKNIFYWKSIDQMAGRAQDRSRESFFEFFLDADDTPVPGGWPRGGVTLIDFPNNHLQYAFTWFGLAGALLIVGGFFLVSRYRAAA